MEDVEVYIEKKQWAKYGLCVIGAVVYSFGMNLFIAPAGFYAGGVMGISQILETVLVSRLGLVSGTVNLSGIFYFLLNLPLFLLAFRSIGKRFLFKTGLNVVVTTILLGLIPKPTVPIVEERLAAALIGGICCGAGVGITLQAGGCCGGMDIVGVYLARKNKDFSVGKLSMLINAAIYGICILLFDVSVAIYCIIYAVFSAMIVDRVHTQSINVEAMIFTKTGGDAICGKIIGEFNRSATVWHGVGGYTEKDTVIVYSVLSKYEARLMRRIVKEIDPHAFIVLNEGCHIDGNFKKHL